VEKINDEAVLAYIDQFAKQFNGLAKEMLTRKLIDESGVETQMFDPESFSKILNSAVDIDTPKLIQAQMDFMEKQVLLWQNATKGLVGESVEDLVSEERGDKRFKDKEWSENSVYNYLKQAYLLNSKMLETMVDSIKFPDDKSQLQAKFYTRQYINSVSPTNYVLTNPEICREILKTEGQCLMKGAENFLRDLEQSPPEAFKIRQTDPDAFVLGENIACTPGKVIYQNEIIQLIHYAPAKKENYERPILITPPFINKYYILDLDQKKSMIRWLLEQGYSVFMISWVNPDESLSDNDFASYMHKGPIAALDVVQKVSGADKVSMVGWCIGGTLLGVTAAYLKAKGDERINSLTFLTTLFEFSEPGELGVYLSDDMLALIEENAERRGYLDGRILGLSFSLLRENNLFWNYFINNYLKGDDPEAFDILHWNSDSTNLPSACFKQYIRSTYFDNLLKTPGAFVLDGVPIDLSSIEAPSYFLSAISDHIVLWKSAYESAQLFSSEKRFVLSSSGHVAGVVNPAEGGKYPHRVSDEFPSDAEDWFTSSSEQEGSWWIDWDKWLSERSGETKRAVVPGRRKAYPVIEDAPGSYVKVRL